MASGGINIQYTNKTYDFYYYKLLIIISQHHGFIHSFDFKSWKINPKTIRYEEVRTHPFDNKYVDFWVISTTNNLHKISL